jgi:hypothetical protein
MCITASHNILVYTFCMNWTFHRCFFVALGLLSLPLKCKFLNICMKWFLLIVLLNTGVTDNFSVFQYSVSSDFFMLPVKILRSKSCLSSHIEISCHFRFLGDVIPLFCMWYLFGSSHKWYRSHIHWNCEVVHHEFMGSDNYMNTNTTCA